MLKSYKSSLICSHNAIEIEYVKALLNLIANLIYQDQERFTSPWARSRADEAKFERVISILGGILRRDTQLQALYHMLVMMSPSTRTPKNIQVKKYLDHIM